LDVGRGRVKQQAGVRLPEAESGVGADDFMKVSAETPLIIPGPSIGGSKLELQGFPWNQAWPAQIAHPVGEPDVGVDRQWRSLQSFDGSEIDRYGGAGDLLEELAAEKEF